MSTRPALAVVEVDGGWLQIRGEGADPGAHDAAWRQDKLAMLATLAINVSDTDPEPDLPDCFRDRKYVEGLVRGIAGQSPLTPSEPSLESPANNPIPDGLRPAGSCEEQAGTAVRSYVASMGCSEQFGPMVAAESRNRNFENAAQRVFVGDGSAWSWKLQKPQFPTFKRSSISLHVLSHVFAAAKAAATGAEERWALFSSWAKACWKRQVGQVIASLRALSERLGPVREADMGRLADDDPRKILVQEIGYAWLFGTEPAAYGLPELSPAGTSLDERSHRVHGEDLQEARERLGKVQGRDGGEAILATPGGVPLRGRPLGAIPQDTALQPIPQLQKQTRIERLRSHS